MQKNPVILSKMTRAFDQAAAQSTPRTNDKALAAYVAAQQQARALLTDVQRYLDAHQDSLDPEEITWGHVSDITRTVAQLKDVLAD